MARSHKVPTQSKQPCDFKHRHLMFFSILPSILAAVTSTVTRVNEILKKSFPQTYGYGLILRDSKPHHNFNLRYFKYVQATCATECFRNDGLRSITKTLQDAEKGWKWHSPRAIFPPNSANRELLCQDDAVLDFVWCLSSRNPNC